MFISTSTCKNILKRNFTKAAIIILTHFLIMQPKYISKYYLFLIISHGRETHCRYRYSTHKSAFMRKVTGNTTPRRTTKLHKVTGPECRAERGPQSVASGLHISPGLLSSQCAAGAGAGRWPCPCAPAWRGCWWTGTGAASQVPVEQHTMHSEAPYRHN